MACASTSHDTVQTTMPAPRHRFSPSQAPPDHPLIERFDLAHPSVPPGPFARGGLEGFTILHLSDLHIRRWSSTTRPPSRGLWPRLLDALAVTPCHLIALTGDLMDKPGQEPAALAAIEALRAVWQPEFGARIALGNHDTPALKRQLHSASNFSSTTLNIHSTPLRLLTLDFPEDPFALALALDNDPSPPPFTIALAHMPTALFPLADLGVPILLAGHTHAGQVRLSPRLAPHTSSDLPPHLASGILRYRSTLCAISRGLGDGVLEGLRFNCPPHIPLYTLRNGPLPGTPSDTVTQALAW